MKITFSLLACLFASITSFAQITSYKIEEKKVEQTVMPYDSLENITRKNLPSLVGQQVQILPQTRYSDLSTGPTLYTSKPTGYSYNNLVVEPDKRFTIYSSRYGAFDNEVFDIIGVDSVCDKSAFMYRNTVFYLIVKNTKYSKPHYLKIGSVNDKINNGIVVKYDENSFRGVIILGYFEKLKENNIGHKLVNIYTNNIYITEPIVYDFETAKPLKEIPQNHIWTIKDIAVVESDAYKGLCYILTSETFPLAFARYYKGYFMEHEKFVKQEAERKNWERSMIKKYGSVNGKLIIQGKVKIGFTKTMCKESWGSPKKINKSTGSWGVHEQWVYGSGTYLYFENGKLTSIDN